jgi:protein-tyrosine phosphatase
MRNQASARGYILNSRARQFIPDRDFDNFDYIVTMDDDNYNNIINLDHKIQYRNKIFKMADFISDKNIKEVPDPYFGGSEGFKFVIDILEDGSKNLLTKIKYDLERIS